jgi:hypothetical protein
LKLLLASWVGNFLAYTRDRFALLAISALINRMLSSSNNHNVRKCLKTFASELSYHLDEFAANGLGFDVIKNIVILFF